MTTREPRTHAASTRPSTRSWRAPTRSTAISRGAATSSTRSSWKEAEETWDAIKGYEPLDRVAKEAVQVAAMVDSLPRNRRPLPRAIRVRGRSRPTPSRGGEALQSSASLAGGLEEGKDDAGVEGLDLDGRSRLALAASPEPALMWTMSATCGHSQPEVLVRQASNGDALQHVERSAPWNLCGRHAKSALREALAHEKTRDTPASRSSPRRARTTIGTSTSLRCRRTGDD